MNNLLGSNSYEKINLPMRKDPSPIALFISNQNKNIGISAVIELLRLINIDHVDPSDIEIIQLDTGQPKVKFKKPISSKEIHISFSHKDKFEVVATSFTPSGIDIEKKRSFNSKLIEKIFVESEFANKNKIFNYIDVINEEKDMDIACTCLFSLKESVSKAVGKGLKIKFNEIRINLMKNKARIEITYLKEIFHGYLIKKGSYVISFVEKIN